MNYLIEPEWIVGEPANGSRELFQCPPDCRQPCDYSGSDPLIQFPRGWHVMAGLPSADTFHQGAVFEPQRARVENGILRLEGGVLEQRKVMLVRRFDTPVDWAPGRVVRLVTHFKPSLEGYADIVTAQQHLFANVELRGELTIPTKGAANQVLGVYLRGTRVFMRYWSGDSPIPATAKSMERAEYSVGFTMNEFHKLGVGLIGANETNTWNAWVRVAYRGRVLFHWRSAKEIYGSRQIHTVALGDERPNDLDGGVWYWQRVRVWTPNADDSAENTEQEIDA